MSKVSILGVWGLGLSIPGFPVYGLTGRIRIPIRQPGWLVDEECDGGGDIGQFGNVLRGRIINSPTP